MLGGVFAIIFQPQVVMQITEAASLTFESAYKGVMRDFPHPRSEEVIKSYAAIRGAEAGLKYAEAFQVAFNVFEF